MIDSKEFWQKWYSTGGTQQKANCMRQCNDEFFWKKDSWESLGVLDAPENIPSGGTTFRVHTVPRE